MLAPNPANRLHCQHSPHRSLESKRAAQQAYLQGVNFGRRSPNSGGQNCTPNNMRDTFGTTVATSSSCFGDVSSDEPESPVMLPPGCARLATKPLPTGLVE